MKFYSVVLSSYQAPIQKPDCINGYLFVDPIYSTAFSYLCTVNDGYFSSPVATPPQLANLYIESFNPYCYYGNLSVNDISNYSQVGSVKITSNNNKYFNLSALRLDNIKFKDSNNLDFGTGSFTLVSVFSGFSALPSTNPRRIISHGHWALSPGYVLQVSKSGKVYSGIGSNIAYGPGCNCVYYETSGSPLKPTGFNHVAAVFNRSTNIANLYVNGVKQYLRPAAVLPLTYLLNVSGIDLDISGAGANSNATSSSPLQIGGASEDNNPNGATSEHYTGSIAVTKIYNYSFTQQQVNNDINTYDYILTASNFYFNASANGGSIYPWGYPIQRRSNEVDIGFYKGDLTLTINPSSISDNFFKILKLIYSNDNGSTITIEKDIVPSYTYSGDNIIRIGADPADPKSYAIQFTYLPTEQQLTSFSASITAIMGNFDFNTFKINFKLLPFSSYDTRSQHLINSIAKTNSKSIEVLEFESPNYITNFEVISAPAVLPKGEIFDGITPTPTPTIPATPTNTPTPTVTPTYTTTPTNTPTYSPTPTNSLTPSITPSITRTNNASPTPTATTTATPTPTPTSVPTSIRVIGAGAPNIDNCYNLVLSATIPTYKPFYYAPTPFIDAVLIFGTTYNGVIDYWPTPTWRIISASTLSVLYSNPSTTPYSVPNTGWVPVNAIGPAPFILLGC